MQVQQLGCGFLEKLQKSVILDTAPSLMLLVLQSSCSQRGKNQHFSSALQRDGGDCRGSNKQ